MEMQNWIIEFNWIKAHAGHHGNELADQHANVATNSTDINECYKRMPISTVLCELCDQSVTKWQSEWDNKTKGAITKSFFPSITDRLKLNLT
jgi:Ribonuclease HI